MKVTCLLSSSLCLHGHFLVAKSETKQNTRLLKNVALGFRGPLPRWPGVAFETPGHRGSGPRNPKTPVLDSEGHFFTFSKGIYNIVRQSLLSLCI